MRPASGPPSLSCLDRLTDDTGILEHAWHSIPRRDHGYCTDDNGRALALVCAVGGDGAESLARRYLGFLRHAHMGGGRFRLRLAYDRRWTDDARSHDADGRALLGIGTAAARGPNPDIRSAATAFADEALGWRSPHWRATASAALGAAALLDVDPDHDAARRLVLDAVQTLPRPRADASWPWPEDRLGYENAKLPHALVRVGTTLGDQAAIDDGTRLLRWLIATETQADHFSFTPVGGSEPGERRPAFDQQPIEAWAMAESALAAMRVAPNPTFEEAIRRAVDWFAGHNDIGVAMVDASTGGGHDGLEPTGVNRNQGAEALLAVLASRQVAWDYTRLAPTTGVRP